MAAPGSGRCCTDELDRRGTKAVAFDVIMSEPQKPTYDSAGVATYDDAIFADAVKNMKRVLIPASLTFEAPPPDAPAVAIGQAELVKDLELPFEKVNDRLTAAGKAAP